MKWYFAGIIDSSLVTKTKIYTKWNKRPEFRIRFKNIDKLLLIAIKNFIDLLSKEIMISSIIMHCTNAHVDLIITDLNLLILIIEILRDRIQTNKIAHINNIINDINYLIPIIL